MFLNEIIEYKRFELQHKKEKFPLESFRHSLRASNRDFKGAIQGKEKISLIAEIKKASPSEGLLRENLNVREIAEIYSRHANAISVVTDERYFEGKDSFVTQARNACSLPVLRKDFIIDEYQVYESRFLEADAILLIAAILGKEELSHFISIARGFAMGCLVEVHNKEELKKALDAGAEIIGINNRDLATFETDLSVSRKLIPFVPENIPVVVESGIHSKHDLLQFKGKADAVLVGSVLMKAENIEEKLKELAE